VTCWIDLETRSTADVTKCGVYVMAADPSLRIISLHYAFDDEAVQHWRGLFANDAAPDFPEASDPPPFELWERIRAGERVAIWNAQFDRHVWNAVAKRSPTMPMLRVEQVWCLATLARAHNLPAKLKEASMWLPPSLRKLANDNFPDLWREAVPLGPEQARLYRQMLTYGDMDVVSMREIARLLPTFEADVAVLQRDYEVSEAINDRGIGIDRVWCRRADGLRKLVEEEVKRKLVEMTKGPCPTCAASGRVPGKLEGKTKLCPTCGGSGDTAITSAKQAKALQAWVLARLDEAGVATEPEQFQKDKRRVRSDGTGYFTEARKSFDKSTRAKLREWMDERGHDVRDVREVLEAIDEGAGAASSKYKAALDRTDSHGILRGMYILDGAAQTGRFASVGMQTHNMVRAVLPDPGEAMQMIMDAPDEEVARVCVEHWGLSVNDTLGRLLRPTLVPRKAGRVLLWGDWSAVEARVCPWLSGSPKAKELLGQFERGEDVYLTQASAIAGRPVTDKKDPARQLGKVAVLSLGFGGAVGAYVAMARNYGVTGLPVEQVKDIVKGWRDANRWAREWWDALEAAARQSFRYPTETYEAGRVGFTYLPGMLEGTLVMWLPCGRPLFYPAAEVRMGKRFEDEQPREVITFRHAAFGRIPLWYGQLAENATQATAASLLRRTLRMLETLVGHTHDEIIAECDESRAREVAQHLRVTMTMVPEWAPGLPLDAEVSAGYAYYDPAPELLAAGGAAA
jgi:hypothetical protein